MTGNRTISNAGLLTVFAASPAFCALLAFTKERRWAMKPSEQRTIVYISCIFSLLMLFFGHFGDWATLNSWSALHWGLLGVYSFSADLIFGALLAKKKV